MMPTVSKKNKKKLERRQIKSREKTNIKHRGRRDRNRSSRTELIRRTPRRPRECPRRNPWKKNQKRHLITKVAKISPRDSVNCSQIRQQITVLSTLRGTLSQ